MKTAAVVWALWWTFGNADIPKGEYRTAAACQRQIVKYAKNGHVAWCERKEKQR